MLKRSKISLIAFISVSLVIIILISLFPDFFVKAESVNIVNVSNYKFTNDYNIDGSYLEDFNSSTSEYIVEFPTFVNDNGFYISSGSIYDTSVFDGFVVMGGQYYNPFDLYYMYQLTQVSHDSFVVNDSQNSSNYYVFVPTNYFSSNSLNLLEYRFKYDSDISSLSGSGLSSPTFNSSFSIDNITYYRFELNSGRNNDNLITCSIPIYQTDATNITTVDGLENLNPNSSGSDSDIFPDGSGGSPANNLYLDSPDFHFNNKKYTPPYSDVINSGDTVPNGTISFNCNLNDFQTSNASNFNLEFSYKLIYDVDYKNHYPTDFGPFKKTSQLLNNKKNLNIPFISGETSVPLTDFINSNNTYSVSFDDVFSQLNYDTYNLKGLLTQSREVSSIEYNKFDLYCNVRLVSQGAKSNLYSEWYNPISKRGYLVSDAITDNDNPYVVNPDHQADSDPDSTNISPEVSVPGSAGSGDSSSSSNSNNNVVVNNYNTNNNNNNNNLQNDNSTPWLINKLFGDDTVQNGAIGDNRVESLTETTGANSWIEVMKQSFSFVPVGFFNQLQLFFGICLGIFVVAFILRIILDLL